MELNIKGNFMQIKRVVTVNSYIQTAIYIKVIGKKIRQMEKENIIIPME